MPSSTGCRRAQVVDEHRWWKQHRSPCDQVHKVSRCGGSQRVYGPVNSNASSMKSCQTSIHNSVFNGTDVFLECVLRQIRCRRLTLSTGGTSSNVAKAGGTSTGYLLLHHFLPCGSAQSTASTRKENEQTRSHHTA